MLDGMLYGLVIVNDENHGAFGASHRCFGGERVVSGRRHRDEAAAYADYRAALAQLLR